MKEMEEIKKKVEMINDQLKESSSDSDGKKKKKKKSKKKKTKKKSKRKSIKKVSSSSSEDEDEKKIEEAEADLRESQQIEFLKEQKRQIEKKIKAIAKDKEENEEEAAKKKKKKIKRRKSKREKESSSSEEEGTELTATAEESEMLPESMVIEKTKREELIEKLKKKRQNLNEEEEDASSFEEGSVEDIKSKPKPNNSAINKANDSFEEDDIIAVDLEDEFEAPPQKPEEPEGDPEVELIDTYKMKNQMKKEAEEKIMKQMSSQVLKRGNSKLGFKKGPMSNRRGPRGGLIQPKLKFSTMTSSPKNQEPKISNQVGFTKSTLPRQTKQKTGRMGKREESDGWGVSKGGLNDKKGNSKSLYPESTKMADDGWGGIGKTDDGWGGVTQSQKPAVKIVDKGGIKIKDIGGFDDDSDNSWDC